MPTRRVELQSSGELPETFFASPGRAPQQELLEDVRQVNADPLLGSLLKTLGAVLLVLNPQRQIIAVNTVLLELLGFENPQSLLGLRPGEALHCVHCHDHPNGCGTSEACRGCGAAVAIVASQESGEIQERDCLLTAEKDGETVSMEFRVRACPLGDGDGRFTLLILQDISDEKRRESLEHIFFHDVMNTLTGLIGYIHMFKEIAETQMQKRLGNRIEELMFRLRDEIEAQRELLSVERGKHVSCRGLVRPSEILDELKTLFLEHPAAEGKRLRIEGSELDEPFLTERPQLHRVLVNMIKNAFEATALGGEIRLRCMETLETVYFYVWNPDAIPDEAVLHIFQRYFTTSGQNGRGLGTYSMKLLTERCLRGEVSFSTSPEKGTTFTLAIPRVPD